MPRRRGTIVLLAGVAALAGCGGEGDYANKPRPPTPINVTAAINEDRISISPRSFGAGPIVLIVSNQSEERQVVTFETEELGGSQPGLKQKTNPISPRATTTLKVDVREGTYAVSTASGDVAPATVKVGARRKTAQDELLQP